MTRHFGKSSNPHCRELNAAIVWLVLLGINGFASDWPGWGGPMRTGHVPTGVAVPATLPREPRAIWRIKIGEGFASPVVAGSKVFYLDNQGDKEVLHALDRNTGHELWRSPIDDVFRDAQSAPGPRCTPLVDGDRVYAQSTKGELRCLAVADGQLKWRVSYTKDFHAAVPAERGLAQGAHRHGFTGSPWVDGERLLAVVGDTNGAGIVCFDKQTGNVLWRSQNDRAGNAAPITQLIDGIPPKQVVAFTVEGLIGLNLENGDLLWRVPLTSTYGRHVTTPVVVGDIIMVASYEISMLGVQITHPAVAGDGSQSAAATQWNAAVKWKTENLMVNFSCPVAVGNYVYGLGPAKNLFCLDANTGKLMWSKTGYAISSGQRGHAGFMVMGKNVLVLTDGGELVLFAANPSEFKELGRAQVCGANWCNPAYADGKLFFRDAHELFCLELLP